MQLIRLPEVLQMVSVGKTTWYSMVKDNKAPAPKRLGARSVAWNKQEIEDWISNLSCNSEAPHLDQIIHLQQAFMDSFITAESGGEAGYCIKVKFESFSKMHIALWFGCCNKTNRKTQVPNEEWRTKLFTTPNLRARVTEKYMQTLMADSTAKMTAHDTERIETKWTIIEATTALKYSNSHLS